MAKQFYSYKIRYEAVASIYLYMVTAPFSWPLKAISELLSGTLRNVIGEVADTLPVRIPDRE